MDAPKIRREEVWEDHVLPGGNGGAEGLRGFCSGEPVLCHPSSRVHLGDELTCASSRGGPGPAPGAGCRDKRSTGMPAGS